MPEKIFMLITNLGKGGAQRVFYDHALQFSKDYQVEEVVFDINEDERLYNSGLPIHSLDVKGSGNPVSGLFNLFKRAKRLRRLIRTGKPDITISHMDGANWVNVLSGTKEKKILVVHGTVLHDRGQSGFMNFLRRKIILPILYNRSAVTVAVSEGIRHELTKFCGVKNAISIPNFFDIEAIQCLAAKPLPSGYATIYSSGQPVLVSSGRFSEQKKQRYLIPIFAAIKKNFPGTKLVLLGDGELREELIKCVKDAGLSLHSVWDNHALTDQYDVYMPGYVKNPFAFLSRSTLFLFPSGWEGFPMALGEAMICGVPVLSADCPTGPREMLAPGTFDALYKLDKIEETSLGYLLPMCGKPNFQQSWVYACNELLGDENKRKEKIKNALQFMKQLDRPIIIKRWDSLLQFTKSE